MKEKIYNFFKLFTKVSRFFSRLAVEFEIMKRVHYISNCYVNSHYIDKIELLDDWYCDEELRVLLKEWTILKRK